MNRLSISLLLAAIAFSPASAQDFKVTVKTAQEPIHSGKYKPTMESLSDYECPEWFEDAKLGLWAHWGVQCAPEDGDWYALIMYEQGSQPYRYQLATMGHPSKVGFKDWIPRWKAENWNPDSLVALYKR